MTDQQNPAVTEQTSAPVTDANTIPPEPTNDEIDHYFKTQGGELPDESANTAKKDENTATGEPDTAKKAVTKDTETADDEDADVGEGGSQNDLQRYKSMAESERIRRKEVQKQIDGIRSENEQLKQTFNRILTKAQEQAQAAEEANTPSMQDDPVAHLAAENAKLKQKMAQFEKFQEQSYQAADMESKQQAFVRAYREKAAEFEKVTPDFRDAYQYLLEQRQAELEIDWSPEEVEQILREDEAALVAKALSSGRNPAESIYKMAKLRGFSGKGNIQTNTGSKVSDKIAENEQKIANLERGIKASKTINGAGHNVPDTLSLEAVASMDDDEFEKLDWNKLMKLG